MNIRFLILFILLSAIACSDKKEEAEPAKTAGKQNIPFDAEKWQMKNKKDYLYRDQMVHELLYTDTLRGINKEQILNILGEPTRVDSNYLFYRLSDNRIGYFTLNAKTLVIVLSNDSSPNKVLLHE